MYKLGAKLWAEFLGSLFLVMAAISPIILFHQTLQSSIGLAVLADAVAVGWILFALIEIFGPISGAHFNPAVSLSLAFSGKLKWRYLPAYILSQICGGLVGTVSSHLMFYHQNPTLVQVATVTRNDGAFASEMLCTFILVFAIHALVAHQSGKLPLVVGLLVGGQLVATSSTMFANPQVTIARMFTYSAAGVRPTDGLVFIGLQLAGAILATVVWRLLFQHSRSRENNV